MAKKTKKTPTEVVTPTASSTSRRADIGYTKSTGFRVVHVDGAWGGVRPDLVFHVTLYSERPAYPESVTVELDPESLKVKETAVAAGSHSGIRELEVCALMNLPVAQALRDWLNEKISFVEAHLSELKSTESKKEN